MSEERSTAAENAEGLSSLSPVELRAQLLHKEKVIQALTERLGETADQLDRLKRMGLDKGHRPSTGGLQREFLEQQEQFADKLGGFVDRWDEHQTFDRLFRMEEIVDEILRAVQSREAPLAAGSHASESRSSMSTGESASQHAMSESADSDSGWQAIKARMLSGDASNPPGVSDDAASEGTSSASAPTALCPEELVAARLKEPFSELSDPSATQFSDEEGSPEPLPDPPSPVEFNASAEAIRQGLDSRDSYIGYLISRLQRAERRHYEPIDWAALTAAPEELISRLKGLEAQLEDHWKQFEVSQSLQRAQLMREQSRLQQVKQQLENEIRSLGSMKSAPVVKETVEDRRLLKMLGLGKSSK